MENFEVRSVLGIRPLGDVPDRYPEKQYFLENGYDAKAPFVKISWEFPRDKNGKKMPAPKDSWEPLENLSEDLRAEWQAKWEATQNTPPRRTSPASTNAPKKGKAPKRKLPAIPRQPNFTQEEVVLEQPTVVVEQTTAVTEQPAPKRKRATYSAGSSEQPPIAVRTSRTMAGKVTFRILRIQPHPTVAGVPAVLMEEEYEDGRSQRIAVPFHALMHDWRGPLCEALANQIDFA